MDTKQPKLILKALFVLACVTLLSYYKLLRNPFHTYTYKGIRVFRSM